MPTTFGPRVTRLGALLLAAVATFGVAMPRARVTARERVGRAVATRLASPRINDRLGWVAPDPQAAASESVTVLRAPSFDGPSAAGFTETRVAPAAPAAAIAPPRGVDPGHRPASAALRYHALARPPPQA